MHGVTGYFVSPEILYPHAKYPRIYCIPLGYLVSPSHSVYYVYPHVKYPSIFCTPSMLMITIIIACYTVSMWHCSTSTITACLFSTACLLSTSRTKPVTISRALLMCAH